MLPAHVHLRAAKLAAKAGNLGLSKTLRGLAKLSAFQARGKSNVKAFPKPRELPLNSIPLNQAALN